MQWKNKKVIVTGGAGVIGKELIKKLIEKKALVKCFDIAPRPQIFPKEIEYCQEDLSKLNFLEFTRFDPEVIFHLVATFEGAEKDINFWEFNFLNNIFLSHKIIDATRGCKNLKKFIFTSSYLIYDPALYLFKNPYSKPVKLREKYRVNPKNLYGVAKYYTERELEYLNNFKEDYPSTFVSARIFRVYGKGSGDIISKWIKAAIESDPIKVFFKENSFDYIFAEDVAEGLLRFAESDRAQGVVNLGSGVSRKIGEVVKIIKEQIPSLIETREATKKDFFEKSCAEISRLKEFTGWKPQITLEQGIKMMIDYEIQQKN